MTIAHLSAYAEHHGNDSAKVFEDKTGILIISPALFRKSSYSKPRLIGAPLAINLALFLQCYESVFG